MKSETRIPFYLAWKYLQRGNKWTLFLTIFLMAVAFVNLVFITSLFNGIIDGSNKQIVNTFTGSIYMTPKDGEDYIKKQSSLVAKIKNTAGVEAASSQVFVPASLEYNSYKGNWTVMAIDPDQEKQVTTVSQNMLSGSYLEKNDLDSIIIGRQIAGGDGVEDNAFSFKGAKVGEKVTVLFNGIQKDFTIKGIFYTKFMNTDSRAFITRQAFAEMVPSIDDLSSTIVIKIHNEKDLNSIIGDLKGQNIDANIYSWKEVSGLMTSVTKSFVSINVLMTFVGILIAAVTIFIIIYVDISNKRRQIGILRALGIKPYLIFCSYVIQAAFYAVSGVILGSAIFFLAITPYFRAHPFVLPICDAVLVIDKADFIGRAETIIWVAVLSAFIPAVTVTKAKILSTIIGK